VNHSVDAISNIERGKGLPSLRTLEAIAVKLQVPISEFFETARGEDEQGSAGSYDCRPGGADARQRREANVIERGPSAWGESSTEGQLGKATAGAVRQSFFSTIAISG
jgi:transcriptional regulator with XRE-family HTH domain